MPFLSVDVVGQYSSPPRIRQSCQPWKNPDGGHPSHLFSLGAAARLSRSDRPAMDSASQLGLERIPWNELDRNHLLSNI